MKEAQQRRRLQPQAPRKQQRLRHPQVRQPAVRSQARQRRLGPTHASAYASSSFDANVTRMQKLPHSAISATHRRAGARNITMRDSIAEESTVLFANGGDNDDDDEILVKSVPHDERFGSGYHNFALDPLSRASESTEGSCTRQPVSSSATLDTDYTALTSRWEQPLPTNLPPMSFDASSTMRIDAAFFPLSPHATPEPPVEHLAILCAPARRIRATEPLRPYAAAATAASAAWPDTNNFLNVFDDGTASSNGSGGGVGGGGEEQVWPKLPLLLRWAPLHFRELLGGGGEGGGEDSGCAGWHRHGARCARRLLTLRTRTHMVCM